MTYDGIHNRKCGVKKNVRKYHHHHFGKNKKFTITDATKKKLLKLGCDSINMRRQTVDNDNDCSTSGVDNDNNVDINDFEDEIVTYFEQKTTQANFECDEIHNRYANHCYDSNNVFKPDLFLSKINRINDEKKSLINFKDENTREKKVLTLARIDSDPFGKLNKGKYMNRCAIKNFNINYLLKNFVNRLLSLKKIIKYGDLCSAPGGFSEAILDIASKVRKEKHDAPMVHSFAISLHDPNFQFSMDRLQSNKDWWNFHAIYADIGDEVAKQGYLTEIGGKYQLDFVLADGGFSVNFQEHKQEYLTRKLYVAQSRLGLDSLKESGTFVLKLFDIYLKFSVDLLHLLSFCFQQIGIVKLHSSRPANSERYLFCLNYKNNHTTEVVSKHLKNVELSLSNNTDHISIDQSTMHDTQFVEWISQHIEQFNRNQLRSLLKLKTSCMNQTIFGVKNYKFPNKDKNNTIPKKWVHHLQKLN